MTGLDSKLLELQPVFLTALNLMHALTYPYRIRVPESKQSDTMQMNALITSRQSFRHMAESFIY